MTVYDQLYADRELEEVITDLELDPASPLGVARARMWEGNYTDAALAAQGGREPWASFIQALAKMRAGVNARANLLPIAEDAFKESRARLWAWTALRKQGEKPSPVHANEVLGVVLEVPVDDELDVLAAYADSQARYLGHTGDMIVYEPETPDPHVTKVVAEAFPLLAIPPKPRDPNDESFDADSVKITVLSALGNHTVEVPWADVEDGGRYAKLFDAAIELLQFVTER